MPKQQNPNASPNSLKKRMMKRDFETRKEWRQVSENLDSELPSVGSTKAAAAGQSPQGQEFIWCLVRGPDDSSDGQSPAEPQVFAVDGACRCCTFPMTA